MLLNKRQLKSSDGELEGIIEEARHELKRRAEERELEAKRREEMGDKDTPIIGGKGGYQWEMVRCKSDCRCNDGAGHGPYLYRYFRSPKTGRMTSEYIGAKATGHPNAPPRPKPEDARQLKPLKEKEEKTH